MIKNIAIISPHKNAYSETFIKAQKDFIESKYSNTSFFYGGVFPLFYGENNLIIPEKEFDILNRIKNKLNLKNELSDSDQLANIFVKEKTNLVLAEYGHTGASILQACKIAEVPLIVHFHGADAYINEIIDNNDYKAMFSYAKSVIAVSSHMYNQLLKLGCPEDKLHYICYGPRKEFSKIERRPIGLNFLSVGRFVEKKAPHILIKDFAKAIEINSAIHLRMAGDGPLLNLCKDLVDSLGLNKNITFLGAINHEEVIHEMASAYAFVQHSITAANGDSEGTPLAILESSAAGLPVISTEHAGIKDVIINGETGLLCQEKDSQKFISNIIDLAKDPKLAASLGKMGKQNISEKFSINQYLSALDELINTTYN